MQQQANSIQDVASKGTVPQMLTEADSMHKSGSSGFLAFPAATVWSMRAASWHYILSHSTYQSPTTPLLWELGLRSSLLLHLISFDEPLPHSIQQPDSRNIHFFPHTLHSTTATSRRPTTIRTMQSRDAASNRDAKSSQRASSASSLRYCSSDSITSFHLFRREPFSIVCDSADMALIAEFERRFDLSDGIATDVTDRMPFKDLLDEGWGVLEVKMKDVESACRPPSKRRWWRRLGCCFL